MCGFDVFCRTSRSSSTSIDFLELLAFVLVIVDAVEPSSSTTVSVAIACEGEVPSDRLVFGVMSIDVLVELLTFGCLSAELRARASRGFILKALDRGLEIS